VTTASLAIPRHGRCALCLQDRDLLESHLVPKALYRLVRAGMRNAHPLQISAAGQRNTSRQAVRRLLCAECEGRFSRNGENWVLRHCYRGRGVFRLRSLLRESTPIPNDSDLLLYQASSVPGVDSEAIVYFCASVVWRAAVANWWVSSIEYEQISLGDQYQEDVRRYLLGEADFPEHVVVVVVLSQLDQPVLTFNLPRTDRFDCCRSHRLHIPGMTFMVMVGREVPRLFGEICLRRAATHPIFVGSLGDRRAQNEIMALMGRTPPPGGSFPLAEGVERP
jgi:hypothetical protein